MIVLARLSNLGTVGGINRQIHMGRECYFPFSNGFIMTRAWNHFSRLYDVSEEPTALSAHARYMRAIVSDYPLMNDDERS